jgi:mRNA interferase MazF
MGASQASRSDMWSVNLDPILGREQSGTRPALVLSVDKFNHGPADLVIVLPSTSKNKRQPLHVEVTPPEGGLKLTSFVKCDDIRSISKQRLKQRYGALSSQTMAEVENRMRILLNL